MERPLDFRDIFILATTLWKLPGAPWWQFAAAHAVAAGLVHLIPTRDGRNLYLARFWLHLTPIYFATGESKPILESGNSTLLHLFVRPDDDGSLHDHPWDFKTRVLAGGYREALPPEGWDRDTEGGPPIDACSRMVRPGQTVEHNSYDLHAVAEIFGETWTLMNTGPRVRMWGFHPHRGPWIPHGEFLHEKRV